MALTADELKSARKAAAQNAEYDKFHGWKNQMVRAICMLPFLLIYVPQELRGTHGPGTVAVTTTIILFVIGVRSWRNRYLKFLYPANRRLLQELKQREGAEAFRDAMDWADITEHPLLERWNRRLEQRALLWRVDEFLSRGRQTT
jgi:hypothetical protein